MYIHSIFIFLFVLYIIKGFHVYITKFNMVNNNIIIEIFLINSYILIKKFVIKLYKIMRKIVSIIFELF